MVKSSNITSHQTSGIIEYARLEIDTLIITGRISTAKNYTTVTKSFGKWLGSDIIPTRIDNTLLLRYASYLTTERHLCRNSISFHMRILKVLITKSLSKYGIHPAADLFDHIYTGADSTRRRAIPESILIELNNMNIESAGMNLARDTFMMSFYTRGMAFIDLAQLRWRDLTPDLSEISYVRHKTSKRIHMSVEPCLRALLDKYGPGKNDTYILPWLSPTNQLNTNDAYREYKTAINTYNRALRDISTMLSVRCGRHIQLRSYVARHSWASAARHLGIPIAVISAGLGHSSERTTEIYLSRIETSQVDIANRLILSKFN